MSIVIHRLTNREVKVAGDDELAIIALAVAVQQKSLSYLEAHSEYVRTYVHTYP